MKGHIRKRSRDSWSLVIDLGRDETGKRKQKWHTVKGKKSDADAELRRLLNDLDEGAYVEPRKFTTKQFLERWLEIIKPLVTLKTYTRYEQIVNKHLSPALGHHLLYKLDASDIELYYTEARKTGNKRTEGALSERSLLHIHRVLSQAMEKAKKLKLRKTNPCGNVEKPRPQKTKAAILDKEQTKQLLTAAKTSKYFPHLILALSTGLRLGEVLGLRWKDIDLDTCELSVCQTVQRVNSQVFIKDTPKTKTSSRNLPVPQIAIELLKAHKSEQAKQRLKLGPVYVDHGLIFPTDDGFPCPPDRVSKAIKKLMQDAGIKNVTFHGLRHSHSSHLIDANVHMKIISERLGHSSIAITMDLYGHLLKGAQNEAASKTDESLREALGNDD